MMFGRNLLTGKEWYLSSWKSSQDPAPGEFTWIADTRGFPQNLLRQDFCCIKAHLELFRAARMFGLGRRCCTVLNLVIIQKGGRNKNQNHLEWSLYGSSFDRLEYMVVRLHIYALDGLFSTKSDVFSFGVMELIDTALAESSNPLEVTRSIQVGLLCVQQSPEDRPSMSSVVLALGGEGALPTPKQPAFFTENNSLASDFSSSSYPTSSTNDLTVTEIVVDRKHMQNFCHMVFAYHFRMVVFGKNFLKLLGVFMI
ncbi:G-type lectin S-receptor-like serine/threonine-protein kinase [Tanacetum coccineum]